MTAPRLRLLFLICCLLATFPALASLKRLGASNEFLPVEQAFQMVTAPEPDGLFVDFRITPGHYLYQSRFRAEAAEGELAIGAPVFAREGEWKNDASFGRVQVFYEDVSLRLPVTGNGVLRLTWQGCANAGLCYPPVSELIAIGNGRLPATTADRAADRPTPAADTGRSSAWLMLGAGLLLAFTPCVLPMLPILAGLIARQHTRSALRGFLLALCYVLGVASTYALTGFLVGLLGAQANLPLWFQHPAVILVFALFFVALALSLFGLYPLHLPAALHARLDALSRRHQGGALFGSWLMGVVSALVVSPCVTAPLAGVLLHVASTGDAWYGARSLFLLALGMGLPLLLLGASEGRLLPRAGHWMNEVKTVFGLGLLVVAAELASRLVPGPVALLLYAFCAASTGFWLWRLAAGIDQAGLLLRGAAVVVLLYAGTLVVGAAAGHDDPWRPLGRLTATAAPAASAPAFL
ncbi:MAG: protein-disulfide reductase DsbD, partial [Moraxellaceae bacterium]